MIRFCAVLAWLALESLVSIGIEQVVRLWLAARPIRRWKERRARKRAEKTGQDVPVIGEGMNEQVASVLRTVIKSAGGSLVGAGIVTDGQMEILAGAAAIIIGMVWSWWVKRKAPATAG